MRRFSFSKKFIITLSVITAILLGWTVGFYIPTLKKIHRMMAELKSKEDQIQSIEALVGGVDSMEEGLQRLKERYDRFDAYFPAREEDPLKKIGVYARDHGIDIENVRAGRRAFWTDDNGETVTVEGRTGYKISVAMDARAPFPKAVEFLHYLEAEIPTLISINTLDLKKVSRDSKILSMNLDFDLYLLTPGHDRKR